MILLEEDYKNNYLKSPLKMGNREISKYCGVQYLLINFVRGSLTILTSC